MQTRTLEMSFNNAAGRTVTKRVAEVKTDVTAGEVNTAMGIILDKNIFSSTGGDLVEKANARIVIRDVEDLAIQ